MSPMNRQCPDCNALLYTEELLKNKFSMCCKQEKVYLEPLPNPPKTLRTLLTSSNDESRDFRRNIRVYNNSFAFTSLGAKQDAQYSGFNFGAYTFRAQDAVYHRIPPLVPQYGYSSQYAQVYFTDPEYQANLRRGIYSQLHTPVIDRIQQMLLTENPFARTFENAREQFADNQTDFHISINGRATATMGRTCSALTSDEVAAIVIDPPSINDLNYVAYLKRDFAVFRRNGHVEHMNECHRAYDPMHCVLMFPRGENGWHTQMLLSLIVQPRLKKLEDKSSCLHLMLDRQEPCINYTKIRRQSSLFLVNQAILSSLHAILIG